MALWGLWHSKSWGTSEGLIVDGAFRVTEETTETAQMKPRKDTELGLRVCCSVFVLRICNAVTPK